MADNSNTGNQGFASMDESKQREIAKEGNAAQPTSAKKKGAEHQSREAKAKGGKH